MTQQNNTEITNNSPAWRYYVVVAAMLCVAVFLSYRALNIQVLENDFLKNQGDARHLRTILLPAHRGMISDRNGEVLAVSSPVVSVWANPQAAPKEPSKYKELAELIKVSEKDISAMIAGKHDKEFVYLRRQMNPAIEDNIRALKIPGISVVREFKRYYPAAEVTSQLVGFTDIDDKGIEGVELQLNDSLKGKPGQDRVVKDRMGRIIDSIDLIEIPESGKNVELSIDKRLQYIAYRELKKQVQAHNAVTGSLVLMDVHTGEILAMVNEPSYNPNRITKADAPNFRNRAMTDLIEPGSTIKPFIAATALKSGMFSPHTPIETNSGVLRVGKNYVRDTHDYGDLDLAGVITKSSNVGISLVALQLPKEMIWESLSDFGFGELTGSQFPGERKGMLPFFGEWDEFEQATLSFGYGISVTPIQLAQAYAMLANGGYLKPVTMLKRDTVPEGKRILSEEITHEIMLMLESVVTREGTALQAGIPGYRVAGKTGTAKKIGKHGYMNKNYQAMFAGVAPASNPQLVAVVIIDDPDIETGYYGGVVAAPVFSRVVSEALRLLDIAPDDVDEKPLRIAQTEGNIH